MGHGLPDISMASHTRSSWHRMATAVTFKPRSLSTLESLMRSQFLSVMTVPPENPMTVDETAPETGMAQTSCEKALMLGAMALGTGWPL